LAVGKKWVYLSETQKIFAMKTYRNIHRIITGRDAIDGAGVQLVRLVGHNDVSDFDPFLLFDAFDATDPSAYMKGFPWHPHRGIETVTYLIRGKIEHGDSMGNKDLIREGDCQWMTAGSGIIHQEMPQPAEHLWGGQLWINLPANQKMTAPRYMPILSKDIPVVKEDNAIIRILTGYYKETAGATQGEFVKANYFDISIQSDTEWEMATDPSHTLFVYILEGKGVFGHDYLHTIPKKHIALFTEGEALKVRTTSKSLRFLLVSGAPLREPIAWGGPIVMNTREELDEAFEELEQKTFIK
jgi:redox-sensitive bicupin YhaK (pirin superfamily)